MRERDRRAECAKINRIFSIINSVLVCLENLVFAFGMFLHVCDCLVVNREDTVLSARLDRHVCNCETIIYGKICYSLSGELHRFIQCAIYADHADDVQDHIFSANPFGRFADQIEFDGRRNLEPCLSGCHSCCHISTADASGKCAECTVGTCMRISTDDHIAGNSQTFFRQKCVLNSHLANIKIICDFMLTCKFAYAFAMLCGLDILVWNKMIHDKRDLILIKYIFIFKFVHLMNGYR